MRHAQFYGANDTVSANTDPLCIPLKRVPLLSFGGIIMAARHMAEIGRRRAEHIVVTRFVAGRRWSDLTERTLNDELTGQNHRSFLP
ncbi:hypothetical protein AC630_36805 [Bradyrhizobium sp. AS23.2]|nr:hypothetical protein AC630_36805 [Bradyrhizobium sp. AS23.2]